MSDPLLDRIAATARAAGLPIGTVTAISTGAGTADIALAGGTVTALAWLGSYTPTVGDRVVMAKAGGQWTILGKHSRVLSGGGVVYGTAVVEPSPGWRGYFAEDYWTWALATDTVPAGQGKRSPYGVDETTAGVWVLPVASAVPSGATVTSAKLRLTRWVPTAEQAQLTPEASLVTPRAYLHTYTALPVGAPTWSSAVWSPGSLAPGQSAAWDLPSAWLTALLAGTARGVGISSAVRTDWTRLLARVDLTYTLPA